MVGELYTKSCLEEKRSELPEWQRFAFELFSETVADEANTFPCIPGRQGFLTNQLRFVFAGDPREYGTAEELAPLLAEYGALARETGRYASLLVFFETPEDLAEHYSIEAYEELFWTFLNRLSEQDEKEWPAEFPADPEHYKWEFCFHGEPYFILCSTPAHEARRSRSFPYFMLAFQPRWVFEGLNASTSFGRKMSKMIRSRLEKYDEATIHPHLRWYGGKGNLEWKQYFLRDDEKQVSKCPFSYIKNMFKGSK
ncbi:YqcI/YcgG family protein [Bacillus atrophaeus]|uniref:YqcI/YcgG family protein n=1 Tax=Bacillus atrophaeus TaxID=1452 RepID=UPI002E1D0F2E|nr:YqcI/YcgG family protein [Bacillus atrophaeus]